MIHMLSVLLYRPGQLRRTIAMPLSEPVSYRSEFHHGQEEPSRRFSVRAQPLCDNDDIHAVQIFRPGSRSLSNADTGRVEAAPNSNHFLT
jgi:hypothetical protein